MGAGNSTSDLPVRLKSTLAPEASGVLGSTQSALAALTSEEAEASGESPVESQPVELSYCSVKNGVNDMLDYIALVVALVAPLIIGPCIVGVFQVRIHTTPPPHLLTIPQRFRLHC